MAVTFGALIPVFANLAPGFLLGVRSDTAEVDLFDNLRQGTISYMQLISHVVELPDERKHRILRVIVKGEGTVTGGHIVGTWDGVSTETYNAVGAFNSVNTVADVLLQQQFLGTKTAREFFVALTLSGTNIVIREMLFDLTSVEA